MESALDFRKKWNVDEAMKRLRAILENFMSFEGMEHFGTLKGYIGLLELDLKNTKEKLDGLRVQSK